LPDVDFSGISSGRQAILTKSLGFLFNSQSRRRAESIQARPVGLGLAEIVRRDALINTA
jgi:hypothetical protein